MSKKYKQDKVTGLVEQSLLKVTIGGALFFVVLIIMSTVLPTFSNYHLYISVVIGIFGYINLIWINIRPNLLARFYLNVSISLLCMIVAFRALDNLMPKFSLYGEIIIVTIIIMAHTLPMWNLPIVNFIRNEVSTPKTKLGKIILKVSLILIPFIGIISAGITSTLYRENKTAGASFILLFLSILFAVILPFAYRYPSSPWEAQNSINKSRKNS